MNRLTGKVVVVTNHHHQCLSKQSLRDFETCVCAKAQPACSGFMKGSRAVGNSRSRRRYVAAQETAAH